MPDYSKGLIYQLCCKNPEITECYVGSTTNKTKRKQEHKSSCNNSNSKKYNNYKYEFIRENGGFENWDLIVIEPFPCNSKEELETRERYWIEKLNSILNSIKRPVRTEQDKIDISKTEKKLYYERHKDKYKEYQKNNKEMINNTRRKYREKNKDKINEQKRKYNEKNKDKINEQKRNCKSYKAKVKCEICNCEFRYDSLLRHSKTKKHINNLL